MSATLVLCRHGQSDWNLKNLFTGWKDPDLTEKGVAEAHEAGKRLKDLGIKFDIAFTSALSRAQRTTAIILEDLGQTGLETIRDQALNERDYGDLSGLNKDEARQKWGEEQVHIWRRSYDVPPPGGESLKDTAARVLPYYIHRILPQAMSGKTVLIGAHGNSLRALIKHLDSISDDEIAGLNIPNGTPLVYELDADLKPIRHYYLGDQEKIAGALAAVAAQGKSK